MGQDTLQYCMKISIEGDEDPPIEYVEEVIDLYATKKLAAYALNDNINYTFFKY